MNKGRDSSGYYLKNNKQNKNKQKNKKVIENIY